MVAFKESEKELSSNTVFESPPATAVNTAAPSRAPSVTYTKNEDLENGVEAEKVASRAAAEEEADTRHPALRCVDPITHIVGWDGADDPENPMNFTRAKKWRITMVTALMTFCVSFASSVFSTATQVTAVKFNVSLEVMILGVSLYVLGFACGRHIFKSFSGTETNNDRPSCMGTT